ncbi:trans-aconitate 2-methyltransferase [Salinispora oceanensis]|uniref:trans-aconitate 2-methyltransferase n=1 Tax=Salinispora oceanensis TaxID=1050199 RepID=UPI00036B2CCF|nr:trans-aconitate 2-methyltransferase [Salinispora oceanensis]
MWDPTTYLRYGDERARPFHDLLARVPTTQPRAVVDLGCGPGTQTTILAERWPGSRVTGIDAAPEMIDRAATLDSPVEFAVADVRHWRPSRDQDVVISNSLLQWVPEHRDLLTRWARELPSGAVLAVQVPGNFDAPSHQALRTVANGSAWRTVLGPLLRDAPVDDSVGYARLLAAEGCAVDAWETSYVHLLAAPADADHPVLSWMEGTALRPVRAALDPTRWADFRRELSVRLVEAYPVQQGQVYFPFRRVFFVARTAARAEESL